MGTRDGKSDGVSDEASFVCPKCGAIGVKPMVRTSGGTYCHCGECDHIWYEECPPRPSSSPLRRRKTD